MSRILAEVAGKLLTLLGYDGTDFRNLHVDAAGDLQVDVVGSALPAGAATEATLATLATEAKLEIVRALLSSIDLETDNVRIDLAALLTELRLKAALTETQPVSAASLPLPTGASTSAKQTTIEAVLDTIAVPVPTMGYWKKANRSVNVPNTTWTIIKEVTVPAGKVHYWMGVYGGMAATNDPWQVRLYENAGNFLGSYVATNPIVINIGLLSKRTAGQTFNLSANQSTGGSKWINCTLTYLEVDA